MVVRAFVFRAVATLAIVCTVATAGMTTAVAAVAPVMVAVAVNGQFIDLPRAPRMEAGVLYVPARSTFEAAGVGVRFMDGQTVFSLSGVEASVDRDGLIELDGRTGGERAKYDNGTLFVPVRLIAESLGLTVGWRALENVLHITGPEGRSEALPSRSGSVPDADPEDVKVMARLIEAEAYGESYEGKVAIGATVVNRVNSSAFPNAIREVIYQRGQFATGAALFQKQPRDVAVRAALDAINGRDPTNGALYFFNPARSQNAFLRSRPVVAEIGNHRFMK